MSFFSKMEQKLTVFFICLLLFYPVLSSSPKEKVNLSQLDRYFEKTRKDWRIPGMAVAIVKDGKVVLAKGYGVKEFSRNEKVNEKTLFAIASNTKSFTAAALAMLVDERKINWDDKVRTYLPYFTLYDPYVTEEMTIRDLLCHRSGLRTYSGDLLWYETSYSTVEIIKRIKYLKPSYGFRSKYGYSNVLFMAAGEVVPAVTGKPWKEFVKERIFKPLNMNTTKIGTSELKNHNNVAASHYVFLEGKTITVPHTSSDNTGGAASINSNVIEMARWLKMLLNKGVIDNQQLLSEDSIWEMWSSQTITQVSRYAANLLPATHFKSFGLGWKLSDYHGYKVVDHGGGLDGMISSVALVPEIKLGLVVLSNSINWLPLALKYKIIDAYLGVTPKDWSSIYQVRYQISVEREMQRGVAITKKCVKTTLTEPNPEDFIGLYNDSMYGDAKVTLQEGKLVLEFLPTPLYISDLTHWQFDTFVLKMRNHVSYVIHGTGLVQFIRNKQGEVVLMKLDIPNRDLWFHVLEFRKKICKE